MIQQNKGDIHLFTTNHPWFLEIGLSSFTTGTLIDWWNQKTADGRYLNRRHINQASPSDPLSDAPKGLDKLLGISTTTEFFWDGWKPNREIPNAGRFKKQNLKGASGHTGGLPENKWEHKGKNINNAAKMNSLKDSEILYAMDLNGVPHFKDSDGSVNDPSTLLKVIKPLYGLIQLNKWMVIYQNYFPRKLWNVNDPLIPDWALLTEIKCSKAGPYLQWSGPVTFYVDNGVFDRCSITENVSFNLYLGNESMMKSGNNAITIKNLTIVGPKFNAIGTISDGEGGRSDPNTNDTSSQTAATLDVQINPVTGKWQSGSKNILARLTTRLDKAPNGPSNAHLAVSDTAEDFADEKNTYSFTPSSGLAMPITSQNLGGLQLGPIYEMTREARCSSTAATEEKNKKITVTVYNFNPVREYKDGETVLLTEMDGRWYVSSLGEANAATTDVAKTSVGKWGAFTYMATSSEFFFKAKKVSGGATVNVTPRSAELNFHKLYYKYSNDSDKALNYRQNYEAAGGYDSAPFNTLAHEEWTDEPGWFQTTSFDYLDSQIFGIRSKAGVDGAKNDNACSISSTSATINAANQSIPIGQKPAGRNSAHTGTFFGCVFPAGYNGTEAYDQERTWKVGAASKGSVSTTDYFNINSDSTNPFDDNTNRNKSNAKCNATEANPITPPEQGPLWSRGSTKLDASLFFLGINDGRKTIPADVMLNASPSGVYGSPIKPIRLFNFMNKDGPKTNPDIVNLVTGGVWLNKAPTTTETAANPNDSAFDFPPKQNDNLMFRPLKLEGYLQFGLPIIAGYKYGTEYEFAKNLTLANVQQTVGGFYAEAARTQTNYKFPISYYAPIREQNNCSYNRIGAAGGALKWGGWVKDLDEAGVPIKASYGTRLHNAGYWNTNAGGGMNWTTKLPTDGVYAKKSNWEGAAAFGVITTSNKVKANNAIEFTTSNFYGMSAAGGTPPFGPFTVQDQEKTWGVSNFTNSYKQEHIIDLSVRIYHGHDSSSTVYDPRYFAVHHFNPGVEFLGNDERPTEQVVFTDLIDSNNNILPSVTYDYQQASGVDVKFPSRYAQEFHTEDGSPYNAVTLENGTFVFSDGTRATGSNVLSAKIMSSQYWNVETKRTGKLLPYRYGFLTMTIPADVGDPLNNAYDMISEQENLELYVSALKDRLIVKNFGTGYNVGDTVGINALNIVLKVTDINAANSAITNLEVVNNGENLPLSFCMPSTSTIKDLGTNLPFKVTTLLSSAGKGFDAYFVCAQVRRKIKCDPKPFLIKQGGNEIVRIAANFAGPTHSTQGGSTDAEAESYINKPGGAKFDLNVGNVKSPDSTYDIFFHFHNDITMTWLACGNTSTGQPHGDVFNPTESEEQHVTIESIKLT